VSSNDVTLRVFRFDPDKDRTPVHSSYEIPYEDGMTVHIALKYIYENMDDTLAFKDSCCYSLKCYGCVVRVDGKEVRACATPVFGGKTYTIDPISTSGVIRDLVVHARFRVPTPSFKNLYSAVVSSGKCISCGDCVDACPHGFIRLDDDKAVLTTMLRQDWCPVGDTLECGECVAACPVYEPA
jgi:succinate dehydrogenase/fumarate reductase-like Fe-S protein